MRRFPATSIGRLLAIGFGLMFVLLGALGGAVYVWQSQSAAAQRDFLQRIAPLAERADQLERSILRYAIAGRSYLLTPTRERANQFEQAREDVEQTLSRLQQAPKEADGDALTRQIAVHLKPYLNEGNRLVARHLTTPVGGPEEAQLALMRERVTESLQRLADLQRGKTATAIATMQTARDRVSSGIATAILAGGVLLLVIAWMTARAVRGPVNRLIAIAGALEAGDWKPALSLEAEARPASPDRPERAEMRMLARAVGSAARALEQREQRLRAQNEELQGQNEEIQAQTEELQAQSEELQAQHEEIQAQNEQLKQQADALTQADLRKNRFLGVLAHELRNPMAPISNCLALLRRSPVGSEHALRAQAMIERQVRHLVRLIDDLLDVTRISQGKIRLQREELDLVEIVRACIEDQQASLEPGERSIRFIAPQGPVLLNGDRTRLSQIAGNLLSNAVKFTDRGGNIVVDLRTDPASRTASLHVSDDGVGLDATLLPLLFQPFAQGAASLDRTHSGLGLGLSLVRALAELHGGEVFASSEGPGRGAQFVVTLPVLA